MLLHGAQGAVQQLVRGFAPTVLLGDEVVNVTSLMLQHGHAAGLHVLLLQCGNLTKFIANNKRVPLAVNEPQKMLTET